MRDEFIQQAGAAARTACASDTLAIHLGAAGEVIECPLGIPDDIASEAFADAMCL
jgi:hypothetical protein